MQATIQSQDVIVSGELRGDINASGQVTLHKTARVSGNIATAQLLMEDGAFFNGHVKMDGMEAEVSKQSELPRSQLETNKKANDKDAEVSPLSATVALNS